jgi:hypothetical protein
MKDKERPQTAETQMGVTRMRKAKSKRRNEDRTMTEERNSMLIAIFDDEQDEALKEVKLLYKGIRRLAISEYLPESYDEDDADENEQIERANRIVAILKKMRYCRRF